MTLADHGKELFSESTTSADREVPETIKYQRGPRKHSTPSKGRIVVSLPCEFVATGSRRRRQQHLRISLANLVHKSLRNLLRKRFRTFSKWDSVYAMFWRNSLHPHELNGLRS